MIIFHLQVLQNPSLNPLLRVQGIFPLASAGNEQAMRKVHFDLHVRKNPLDCVSLH